MQKTSKILLLIYALLFVTVTAIIGVRMLRTNPRLQEFFSKEMHVDYTAFLDIPQIRSFDTLIVHGRWNVSFAESDTVSITKIRIPVRSYLISENSDNKSTYSERFSPGIQKKPFSKDSINNSNWIVQSGNKLIINDNNMLGYSRHRIQLTLSTQQFPKIISYGNFIITGNHYPDTLNLKALNKAIVSAGNIKSEHITLHQSGNSSVKIRLQKGDQSIAADVFNTGNLQIFCQPKKGEHPTSNISLNLYDTAYCNLIGKYQNLTVKRYNEAELALGIAFDFKSIK